ncbi:ImmA/IrrE family metallo-endopeptidase [Brevibacillus halotolerans]|uniref:ImmA/IrrE family metallo-endopeptidase n=1 Tax=Brevibacillus TaxID=55080 RepID=UPI00215CDCAA|nr:MULTISPECIES: ImmA/IrrE family metallo-endopeptidase [Brevibacillus]MCR8964783.1 ImmA/IrrE family metallo-endopeptidase [Brevibacillus laterosporus]MCZ0836938.1 ImmA/IrrE family metallo-endopeptidase [Brevibacillus halotolerans]
MVKCYKTNCPFTISRVLGNHIRFTDLGQTQEGFIKAKLRRRFIVIHDDVHNEWQRFVCAHKLGHDRLHKGFRVLFP